MTLGAALVMNRSRISLENLLKEISQEIGKSNLHCSNLNHYQIIHFIRRIIYKKIRCFGVISHKRTLGSYKREISEDSGMYYNKCVQYLLERVAWFMEDRGIPAENLDIVFERANHDYNRMRNFLWTCQSNPKREATKKLKNIDLMNIYIKKKSEEPLLQLADLVAHSIYKCVDRVDRNLRITEARYVRELAPIFFGNPESGQVVGAGLYCVHSLRDLRLDRDVEDTLKGLIATAPESVATEATSSG